MDDVKGRLVSAAAELLRPMVRRLIEMGVPFGTFELALRELFVRVAESDLALPAMRQTDSRIALITGINRKEVKRIRSAKTVRKAPRSFSVNQATSLISRWRSDPQTTDRRGRPVPLPYQSGRGPSFVKLARKLTGDLAPRVLLNELVRNGSVELVENDVVVLRAEAYVPTLEESGVKILAEDSAELIETILRNIFSDERDRLLQRKVFYDNLGSDAAESIRTQMRREGERFLQRVDRLLANYDRDRNPRAPGGDRHYAALGVYFYEAPPIASASTPPAATRAKLGRRRVNK